MTSSEQCVQQIRPEWAELGVALGDPACPVAQDIDSAHDVLETALDEGLISPHVFAARVAVLQERRIVLGIAQARNGCSRMALSEVERSQDGVNFNCRLPIGRIENFAFGTPDQMAATAQNPTITNNGRIVGFGNGR